MQADAIDIDRDHEPAMPRTPTAPNVPLSVTTSSFFTTHAGGRPVLPIIQLGQKFNFGFGDSGGAGSAEDRGITTSLWTDTTPGAVEEDDDDEILRQHALIAKQQWNPSPHDPSMTSEVAGRIFDDIFVPSIPDASEEANANLVKALEQGAAKFQGDDEQPNLDMEVQGLVDTHPGVGVSSLSSFNVQNHQSLQVAGPGAASSSGSGGLEAFSDDGGDAWSRATLRSGTPTDFSVDDRDFVLDDDMDTDMADVQGDGDGDEDMGFGYNDGDPIETLRTKGKQTIRPQWSPLYSPTSASLNSPTSPVCYLKPDDASPPSFNPNDATPQARTLPRPASEIFQPALANPYNPGFFEVENHGGSHFAADFTDAQPLDQEKSTMTLRFTNVQPLDQNKTMIMLQFSNHPKEAQRFASAAVKWRVIPLPQSMDGAKVPEGKPKILYHAPKLSYGSSTEEQHTTVQLPVQASAGLIASAGAIPELGHQIDREVSHSMAIIGSVRRERSEGVWTIEENASARSGIPTEFQLAMVVGHEGPFVTEIVTSAEVKGEGIVGLKGKALKSNHRCVRWVDVERWRKGKEQEGEDLEMQMKVKEMMDNMTGVVGDARP